MNNSSDMSARRYAIGAREATTRDFDVKNEEQLEAVLAEINKILTIKLLVLYKGCDLMSGSRYDSFALTKSALDVIVSALQLARQRATAEMLALLRIALESGSTALHIANSPEAYEQYLQGNYRSTAAISFAKRTIPVIGELWGIFSNFSVHITRLGFGPKYVQEQKELKGPYVDIEFDKRKHSPIQDKCALAFMSLISALLLKITELVLFHESPLHDKWLRLAGTKIDYFCGTDARIVKYYDDLHALTLQWKNEQEAQ